MIDERKNEETLGSSADLERSKRLKERDKRLRKIEVFIKGKNTDEKTVCRELENIPGFKNRRELFGEENAWIEIQGDNLNSLVDNICRVLNIRGLKINETGILLGMNFPMPKEKLIKMIKSNGGAF